MSDTKKPAVKAPTAIEAINAFNRGAKLLVTDLKKRNPTDTVVWQAHSRAMIVIEHNPAFVMMTMGPHLFKYRDDIYAGNEKFFIDNSYQDELKAGEKEEKVEMVKYLIPKIKEAWKKLSDKEKNNYKEAVGGLLDSYLDYLIATKPAKTKT